MLHEPKLQNSTLPGGKDVFSNIAIFGERCSGTNYVEALIDCNFPNLEKNGEYGWKHGFVNMHYIRPTSFFVVVVRDALDWFRSFHRTPHQVAEWSKTATLSEFLRHEWSCVTNGRILPKSNKQLGLSRTDELMCERHPMTGERIKNVVEMRNLKLAGVRKLQNMTPNVAVVRYEDARDAPEEVIDALQQQLDQPAKAKISTIGKDVSRIVGRYKADRARDLPELAEYSDADLNFIANNLDLTQEHSFGYSYEFADTVREMRG